LVEGGLGGSPAEHGDDVAVSVFAVVLAVNVIDVFGEYCMDATSDKVAGDGVADLAGSDDSGFVVWQRGITEGA